MRTNYRQFSLPAPHDKLTNLQFGRKHVLIAWRTTDAYGARKQAPLPTPSFALRHTCGKMARVNRLGQTALMELA